MELKKENMFKSYCEIYVTAGELENSMTTEAWRRSGLEGIAKEEILAKVVWTEKLWSAKQRMEQDEEEEREIISISEESSTVAGGIPYSPISSETTTTVATEGWTSVEEHQWNSGPGSEMENPAVGPGPLVGWHRPYVHMDAHQQNSGPGSELENPAVGPGLLVADGPQLVGPPRDVTPYEVAINLVDGWFLPRRN